MGLVRVGVRSLSFGVAAVALGLILKLSVMQPSSTDLEFPVVQAGFSVFGKIYPDKGRTDLQPPADRLRVASLDPQLSLDALTDEDSVSADTATGVLMKRASFDERFVSLEDRMASFEERFGSETPERAGNIRLSPDRENGKADPSSAEQQAGKPPLPPVARRHIRPGQVEKDTPPTAGGDGRTAIYDISAKVVYLPNGRRLEAHSGLGQFIDNPRHVHLRMRGSTPPNLYKLSMRERLFHGVRALRMTPTNSGRMYGRAGILAHTYMLGPSGQSNGCVSFKNYPEFLNAYLKGDITHIAVVDRLDNPPGPKFASGWLPAAIRNLFASSDGSSAYADAGGQ